MKFINEINPLQNIITSIIKKENKYLVERIIDIARDRLRQLNEFAQSEFESSLSAIYSLEKDENKLKNIGNKFQNLIYPECFNVIGAVHQWEFWDYFNH